MKSERRGVVDEADHGETAGESFAFLVLFRVIDAQHAVEVGAHAPPFGADFVIVPVAAAQHLVQFRHV